MALRVCEGGEAVLELRGGLGGAALLAGVHAGRRARLTFPARRLVVEGPDVAAFWLRWIGAPLEGAMIGALLDQRVEGPRQVGSWRIDASRWRAGERLPGRVEAATRAGDRLVLQKLAERPAAGPPIFPGPRGRGDWRIVTETGETLGRGEAPADGP